MRTNTHLWTPPPPVYVPTWPVTLPPNGHVEIPDFLEEARRRERERYGSVKHPGLRPWVRQIIECVVSHDETRQDSELAGADTTIDTASITLAAGSLMLGAFGSYDPGSGQPRLVTTTGCTLDGSTNFTVGIAGQNTPDTDHACGLWYLPNAASGSHFARFVFVNPQSDTTLYLMEVLGAATTSPADSAGLSTNGTSTTPSSGSHAASASDDFWIAVAMSESILGTPAGGSGWTMSSSMTTAAHKRSAVEYQANPGSATRTGDFSGFNNSGWAALVMPFKAAAAGGRTTKNTRAFPLGTEIGMNWNGAV